MDVTKISEVIDDYDRLVERAVTIANGCPFDCAIALAEQSEAMPA